VNNQVKFILETEKRKRHSTIYNHEATNAAQFQVCTGEMFYRMTTKYILT